MNNDIIDELTTYIDDFRMYCSVERDLRKHTIDQHVSHLRIISRFLTDGSLQFSLTSSHKFIQYIKETKDPGTVGGYIFTLRVFCHYLVKRGIVDTYWGNELKLPRRVKKLPEVLSVEEVEAILKAHPSRSERFGEQTDEFWDTLFLFLATTGCRVSEALNSRLTDFDFTKGIWKITDSKTRTQRHVPLSKPLITALNALVSNKRPSDYIYTTARTDMIGRRLSAEAVRAEMRRRVQLARITKDVSPHTFRHSFITELLRQDISILKVAQIVGHEEVVTTQKYAKLLFEDLTNSINRHPIISKTRNPYEILEHIKETIKHFRLTEDKRFFFEMSEGNDGIRINLFVR